MQKFLSSLSPGIQSQPCSTPRACLAVLCLLLLLPLSLPQEWFSREGARKNSTPPAEHPQSRARRHGTAWRSPRLLFQGQLERGQQLRPLFWCQLPAMCGAWITGSRSVPDPNGAVIACPPPQLTPPKSPFWVVLWKNRRKNFPSWRWGCSRTEGHCDGQS